MEKKYIDLMKQFFEKQKMRYALIGGLALNAYGYSRFTTDIDFLTDFINSEKIVEYLNSLGFKLLQKDSAFSLHTLLGERIDLMYVSGATADKILSSTLQKSVGDIELPVISPIHLAMMKGFAASQDPKRGRDLDDIKELYYRDVISKVTVEEVAKKYHHDNCFYEILNEKKKEL